jgi:hypothetical protein
LRRRLRGRLITCQCSGPAGTVSLIGAPAVGRPLIGLTLCGGDEQRDGSE